MSKTKTKHSTCAVYRPIKRNGVSTGLWQLIGYLSARDEEQGLDIRYDKMGYKIVAL